MFKELRKYWRNDLIAAISVSLVALPLALGIAIASGSPPISGIISVVIGGLVTTFVRGSHVAINGPANSLIVIILYGNQLLSSEGSSGFPYVLAAICVAGVLQFLLGVFKLGRFGEVIPKGVVHGLLAGIGVIILVKQIHVGLGHNSTAESTIGSIIELKDSLFSLNPVITLVTVLSLLILILYPKVNNKLFHYIPAPVWVLIFAVPTVFIYRHWITDFFDITNPALIFSESSLIDLPNDLLGAIEYPNFGKIATFNFWIVVFTILIVTTIETLVSTKAVDEIDPQGRRTDLNKDLRGMGISSALAGLVGGLPIVTVIVRSSVNVSNDAKSKYSNFFHGLIILVFVFFMSDLLEQVPLAALAAILIFTGYRLTSPSNFVDAYERGEEQLLIMAFSVITVVLYGLLWGLFLGLMMSQLIQWIKSRMTIKSYVKAIIGPRIQPIQHHDRFEVRLSGIFNFLNLLILKKEIYNSPKNEMIEMNLEEVILADFSVLEFLNNYTHRYNQRGGSCRIMGLENHEATSNHPNSLRTLPPQFQKSSRWMTQHQRDMMKTAANYGWQFVIGKEFEFDELKQFEFFKKHPIEYIHNASTGLLEEYQLFFRIMDVVFDEGALQAKTHYDTTVMILELRDPIPEFVLEKEELYDRLLSRIGFNDVDFESDPEFSRKVLLRGTIPDRVSALFQPKLRAFIVQNLNFHIESTSEQLLIFSDMRPLNHEEIEALYNFTKELTSYLSQQPVNQPYNGQNANSSDRPESGDL